MTDITGRKFGLLTAIKEASKIKNGVKWVCMCECGIIKEVAKPHLLSGHTKSCGCLTKLNNQHLKINITGQKFGRLTAIKEIGKIKGVIKWLCQCECGTLKELRVAVLRNGTVRSCGCLNKDKVIERNTTHNMTYHTLFNVWKGMIDRCTNPKCSSYKRYGKIGISVCDRWAGDKGIHNFVKDMGERPEGTSLDRIDNTQGYSPENCRWAFPKQQSNNRKDNIFIEYQGKSKTISQWANDNNILYSTFYTRLSRGWKIEEVIQGFRNTD